jgi:hypothetical protein
LLQSRNNIALVRGSFKTTSHEIEGRWKYGSFDDRGFCLIFAPENVTMSSFFNPRGFILASYRNDPGVRAAERTASTAALA